MATVEEDAPGTAARLHPAFIDVVEGEGGGMAVLPLPVDDASPTAGTTGARRVEPDGVVDRVAATEEGPVRRQESERTSAPSSALPGGTFSSESEPPIGPFRFSGASGNSAGIRTWSPLG